jgi:type II secretory pathway pseudopilin PulG
VKNQAGQTLIETIVAIFLLTMALSGGLALTIFSISRSKVSLDQIAATNLAREGVEAVQMMRDSNWLASDVKGGPWGLTSCADIGGALCYPRAYQAVPPYNSFGLADGSYKASYSVGTRSWALTNPGSYNLYQQANGTFTHTQNGNSIYARQVKISRNSAAPYTNQNSNWELIVKSTVVWRDKNCPTLVGTEDLENFNSECKITIEEHLTNWKDFK